MTEKINPADAIRLLDEVINQYIDSVTLEQLASQLPAVAAGKSEGCCSCGTKNEK